MSAPEIRHQWTPVQVRYVKQFGHDNQASIASLFNKRYGAVIDALIAEDDIRNIQTNPAKYYGRTVTDINHQAKAMAKSMASGADLIVKMPLPSVNTTAKGNNERGIAKTNTAAAANKKGRISTDSTKFNTAAMDGRGNKVNTTHEADGVISNSVGRGWELVKEDPGWDIL
ncbi:hypothetical protein GE09DRAFT_1076928 [Coniochaeta sp. 2T2.1]|nr:hypothetical protein GE09DRAFT_1076928 [Coniochaeta sp. 2T2.1]